MDVPLQDVVRCKAGSCGLVCIRHAVSNLRTQREIEAGGLWLGYKHQWDMCISVQRTYTEGLVQDSLRGPAEPACCVRGLQVFSTLNDVINDTLLTLQYAKCLEHVSMEMWEQPGRQRGADGEGVVQDPTSM